MSAKVRGESMRRSFRSAGGQVLRRFGLLPGGMADGLGEDETLIGKPLDATFVVYFADTADGLYQLRQWYGPLAELATHHPLVVITRDSRAARVIRVESRLPTVTIAHYATLDDILARSQVKVALYVNHSPENFTLLRFTSLVHVSLLHGDSDKVVSVSNQVKAYDFSFVAGQAAVDRLTAHVPLFDAEARCVLVGRPQADLEAAPIEVRRTRPYNVLYAPTWEGAQPSAGYSSVISHGEQLVARLLAESDIALTYRPHPLCGVRLPEFGEADGRIRHLIASADDAAHRVSDADLAFDFAAADLLICDVSAIAIDWLATGRPLVMTVPVDPQAVVAETPILRETRRLTVEDVAAAAAVVREEIGADPHGEARRRLTRHYLGDTSPGASMHRFLAECDHMLDIHARAVAPLSV